MFAFFFLLSCIPFYLIGAFPTGYLLSRLQGIDITKEGSGNVGATNVARILGRRAGFITLGVDVIKGCLPLFVGELLTANPALTAWYGLAIAAGHCFSVPGRLKGGKGVATAFGVFLYINPTAALAGLAVFAICLVCFRIVSAASICAAIGSTLFAILSGSPDSAALPLAAVSLLVIFRHKDNLVRLSESREPKFSLAYPAVGLKNPDEKRGS